MTTCKTCKKATSTNAMKTKVENHLNKIAKSWDADPAIVELTDHKDVIEIRFDGTMYDMIYDPSSSDIGSLIRQSDEEFGFKTPKEEIYKAQYGKHDAFVEFLEKNGWTYEIEGGGIMRLYLDS